MSAYPRHYERGTNTVVSIGLLFALTLSGCIPIRAVFYGVPDKKDIVRFPASTIESGDDCFAFHSDTSETGKRLKVNDWSSGSPFFVTLDALNRSRAVRSMLVIRNDTLLYEFYGQGTDENSLNASYSMAKSFTSALIGIAISEGHIKSVDDRVVDHISEIANVPHAEKLTIGHLLNMTSGIKYKLQTDAVIYYGNDVTKALKHIEFEHEPGTFQRYLNINVQLLGLILERATGKKPSEYLSEKIWKPIHMCSDATWTKDRKGHDLTYCCMGVTAQDYAKFGRLYLHQGNWNGKQIVPREWVERSVSRDTTDGSSFGYNYLWHIGEAAYGDFMADGMYKQHIYVYPKKDIIIVLTANRDDKLKAERVRWRNVFRQIVDQLRDGH